MYANAEHTYLYRQNKIKLMLTQTVDKNDA